MAAETRHIFLIEEEWLAQILSHPGQCCLLCWTIDTGVCSCKEAVGPKR